MLPTESAVRNVAFVIAGLALGLFSLAIASPAQAPAPVSRGYARGQSGLLV